MIKVMLVDDQNLVRKGVRSLLELSEEIEVVAEAADGAEAIRLFDAHGDQVRFALLDVIMPTLGGRAVFDHIRSAGGRFPILFASGYSQNGVHTNFVLDEGFDLIQKPFEGVDLLTRVRAILDQE